MRLSVGTDLKETTLVSGIHELHVALATLLSFGMFYRKEQQRTCSNSRLHNSFEDEKLQELQLQLELKRKGQNIAVNSIRKMLILL